MGRLVIVRHKTTSFHSLTRRTRFRVGGVRSGCAASQSSRVAFVAGQLTSQFVEVQESWGRGSPGTRWECGGQSNHAVMMPCDYAAREAASPVWAVTGRGYVDHPGDRRGSACDFRPRDDASSNGRLCVPCPGSEIGHSPLHWRSMQYGHSRHVLCDSDIVKTRQLA